MALHQTLNQLANKFAVDVLSAIRGASLEEVLGQAPARGGREKKVARTGAPAPSARRATVAPRSTDRRARRSEEDLDKEIGAIEAVLRKNKGGLRSEELRAVMGKKREEIQRPLLLAVKHGRIQKAGEKRLTVYSLS